jgi:hypothetical protein
MEALPVMVRIRQQHPVMWPGPRVVVTNGEVEIRYVIPTSPRGEQVCFGDLRTDYFDPGTQAEGVAHRVVDLGLRACPADWS